MIPLLLLQHSEAARTDRMFRNGLASLEYAPAKPLSSSQIRQAAAEAPSSPGVFVATHRAALATATIAGVVGGVCLWQVARTAMDNSPLQEPNTPAQLPADSLNASEIPMVVPDTIAPTEHPEAKNRPETIVVTKEIVVNDTVFVRDTAIVKDTVYLMKKQ